MGLPVWTMRPLERINEVTDEYVYVYEYVYVTSDSRTRTRTRTRTRSSLRSFVSHVRFSKRKSSFLLLRNPLQRRQQSPWTRGAFRAERRTREHLVIREAAVDQVVRGAQARAEKREGLTGAGVAIHLGQTDGGGNADPVHGIERALAFGSVAHRHHELVDVVREHLPVGVCRVVAGGIDEQYQPVRARDELEHGLVFGLTQAIAQEQLALRVEH